MRAKFVVLPAVALSAACTEALAPVPEPTASAELTDIVKPTERIRAQHPDADTLLIVTIDGVSTRVLVGQLQELNPNDVERLEVVKAASTAALYGADTRCPAIIVRTRRP